MSAIATDMEALQDRLTALAHKAGRVSFANEVGQWAVANREHLSPRLREELAKMIVEAGE